jgi:hypothetical protein
MRNKLPRLKLIATSILAYYLHSNLGAYPWNEATRRGSIMVRFYSGKKVIVYIMQLQDW